MRRYLPCAFSAALCLAHPVHAQTDRDTAAYRTRGEEALQRLKGEPAPPSRARNVIIFIGDGMGISTLTTARIFAGQSAGKDGELFQRFGSTALFDAGVSIRVGQNVTIKAGAENIFGTYPDEATNQAVRGLIYSRNAPYDTDGGQYHARVGIRF